MGHRERLQADPRSLEDDRLHPRLRCHGRMVAGAMRPRWSRPVTLRACPTSMPPSASSSPSSSPRTPSSRPRPASTATTARGRMRPRPGGCARLEAGDRWLARFGALADLTPDEAIDRDLVVGELEAARFAETELAEDAWNPLDWVYLLGEGMFTLIAREFAPLADRLASVAGRLERHARSSSDGAREALVGHRRAGRSGRFQTETALRQLPGIDELIDDALADGRRRRRRRPRSPRCAAAPRGGRDRPGRARRVRDATCATSSCPRATAKAAWAATCSPEDAPHDALRRADRRTGSSPRPSASTARSVPRWSGWPATLWPAWCGDRAAPRRRRRDRPRRPRRGRRRAPEGGRPARLLPRGERADRGVLPRARPHRPRRRAAGHPVDAGVPARVRRRDAVVARARSTRARRRSSRSPRCPTTGRRSGASRTCARTTTGCSGC